MATSLHVCRTYKVEYGACPMFGWDEIQKFIEWLREKCLEKDFCSLYINNDESVIEIDKEEAREIIGIKPRHQYKKVLKTCLETADKDNEYIHIEIF